MRPPKKDLKKIEKKEGTEIKSRNLTKLSIMLFTNGSILMCFRKGKQNKSNSFNSALGFLVFTTLLPNQYKIIKTNFFSDYLPHKIWE